MSVDLLGLEGLLEELLQLSQVVPGADNLKGGIMSVLNLSVEEVLALPDKDL